MGCGCGGRKAMVRSTRSAGQVKNPVPSVARSADNVTKAKIYQSGTMNKTIRKKV